MNFVHHKSLAYPKAYIYCGSNTAARRRSCTAVVPLCRSGMKWNWMKPFGRSAGKQQLYFCIISGNLLLVEAGHLQTATLDFERNRLQPENSEKKNTNCILRMYNIIYYSSTTYIPYLPLVSSAQSSTSSLLSTCDSRGFRSDEVGAARTTEVLGKRIKGTSYNPVPRVILSFT